MANGIPSPQPSPGRNRLTKPAPTAAQVLARRLLEQDLRASSRRRSLTEVMARLFRRLRTPAAAGGEAPGSGYESPSGHQEHQGHYGPPSPGGRGSSSPGGNRATAARASEKSAHQVLAELSPAEVQQVLQAALELVSGNRSYQRAFEKKRLPVIEELLNRAALGDQSPSPRARPASTTPPRSRATHSSSGHRPAEDGRTTGPAPSAVSSDSSLSRRRSESPAPSLQQPAPHARADTRQRPDSPAVTPMPDTPESMTDLISGANALYSRLAGNESWATYGQTAGPQASVNFAQDSAHAASWPLGEAAGPEARALSDWSESRPFSPLQGRESSFSRPRPLPSEAAREAYGFITDNGTRVSRSQSGGGDTTPVRPVSRQSAQTRGSGPAR